MRITYDMATWLSRKRQGDSDEAIESFLKMRREYWYRRGIQLMDRYKVLSENPYWSTLLGPIGSDTP
jgi:hypothetical protein